jgi:hypothetical protein
VLALAFVWFIQPRLTQYSRATADAVPLENRVATMERLVQQAGAQTLDPDPGSLAEFERRVPTADRTPELLEQLARLALDSAPAGKTKALLIEAGDRQTMDSMGSVVGFGPRVVQTSGETPDPRLGLFPVPLTYTPVTLSFDSTYEAIGRFFWGVQHLPTAIEIRRADLTRGLPLMKIRVVLYAFQRSAVTPAASGTPAPPTQRADGARVETRPGA